MLLVRLSLILPIILSRLSSSAKDQPSQGLIHQVDDSKQSRIPFFSCMTPVASNQFLRRNEILDCFIVMGSTIDISHTILEAVPLRGIRANDGMVRIGNLVTPQDWQRLEKSVILLRGTVLERLECTCCQVRNDIIIDALRVRLQRCNHVYSLNHSMTTSRRYRQGFRRFLRNDRRYFFFNFPYRLTLNHLPHFVCCKSFVLDQGTSKPM